MSWLENVRTCVERKIPLYYAGQGTEKTKAHLGATFIPSFLLFKHRQPVFDRLLVGLPTLIEKILSHLGFWPAVSPRAASDVLSRGRQEHLLVRHLDPAAQVSEAPRSKLRGILSEIAPKPYPPSLPRATARSPRHSSLQQAAEYPGEGE